MPAQHTITVSPTARIEAGALEGHEAHCTCGYTASSSLGRREALGIGHAHAEWARKAGK